MGHIPTRAWRSVAAESSTALLRKAVARDYVVQHFKLDDTTRIKTIGEGKSADAPDGGAIAVMIYPAGKASQ
jgi:hypothetical protein